MVQRSRLSTGLSGVAGEYFVAAEQMTWVCERTPRQVLDQTSPAFIRAPSGNSYAGGVTKSSRIRKAADDPFSTRQSRMKRTASRMPGRA